VMSSATMILIFFAKCHQFRINRKIEQCVINESVIPTVSDSSSIQRVGLMNVRIIAGKSIHNQYIGVKSN